MHELQSNSFKLELHVSQVEKHGSQIILFILFTNLRGHDVKHSDVSLLKK